MIRATELGLVVESSITGAHLELANRSRIKLFLTFVNPTTPADLLAQLPSPKTEGVRRFLEHCISLHMLVPLGPDGSPEGEPHLAYWEPHDLYFHMRSRRGTHGFPIGATFHLADTLPNVPATKPEPEQAGAAFPLPRDHGPQRESMTLYQALEERRSRYSTAPVDLSRLSSFLRHTCRAASIADAPRVGRVLKKLYPSGGSLHSLEVYILPNRCPGLPRRVYRYRPLTHDLVAIGPFTEDAWDLLAEAAAATGGQLSDLPSALFVFSSRFGRMAWKYQSLAYSAVLKEVGVLQQTMYLVATSMGLSASAIGAGNSRCFSRLIRTDGLEEPSVGELILGG